MFRIMIITSGYLLTEYDLGFHESKLASLDTKISLLSNESHALWVEHYSTRKSSAEMVKYWEKNREYGKKINDLGIEKKIEYNKAKNTIALVGTKTRAEFLIKQFIKQNEGKYQKCEFDIQKVKK